jgi:hypothetical protein
MKHVARLEDKKSSASCESTRKDSEGSRLPMLQGGQSLGDPRVRLLVDLMRRMVFGQGKGRRMVMGMRMRGTGPIEVRAAAFKPRMVGENFLGGCLFDRH